MSMTDPITPSPELVGQWLCSEDYLSDVTTKSTMTITSSRLQNVATQAARWGSGQELEACCEWLDRNSPVIGGFHLRIDRRPKSLSRKEQALEAIGRLCASVIHDDLKDDAATIRRALEALDD